MTKLVLAICAVVGAILGAVVGTVAGREHHEVSPASDALTRSEKLKSEVDRLQVRFAELRHDLDLARTPAAATAAREKLFQLRVDMVAVEDEIAVLARRRAAARDY